MHAEWQLIAIEQAAPWTAGAREHRMLAAVPRIGVDLPDGPKQIPGRGAATQGRGKFCSHRGENFERLGSGRGRNGAVPARGARPMTGARGTDARTGNVQRAQRENVTRGAEQKKRCWHAVELGRVGTEIGDAEAVQAIGLVEDKT